MHKGQKSRAGECLNYRVDRPEYFGKSVFELFIAESKSKIINKEGNNLTLGTNLPLRAPHYIPPTATSKQTISTG